MKKLILYGIKNGQRKENLATIYVDEKKKVIVETDDPQVKKGLLDAIYDPDAPNEPPVFILRTSGPKEAQEEDKELGRHSTWAKSQRPGDPQFLEAMWDWVKWHAGDIGGYSIGAQKKE